MSITDYIYLDCAASNPNPKYTVKDEYANPNSTHSAGRESFAVLDEARNRLAKAIGAKRPSEITFTSGATESNNIAIFGIARKIREDRLAKNDKRPVRVITSSIEHESVLRPCEELAKEGFDVVFLPVDSKGFINQRDFIKALTDTTGLVTIQLANSEVGVIQDLCPLIKMAHDSGVIFHSDLVGAFGKIPLDVSYYGIDAASFSGHKVGAPKGIGALYVKSDTPIKPLVFGSGQENGLRSGTQNVTGASAFGLASEYIIDHIYDEEKRLRKIRDYVFNELSLLPNINITLLEQDGVNHQYLPNLIHVCFTDNNNDEIILQFDKCGIEVSGGAACSSQSEKEPPYVLQQLGLDNSDAFGAIRISFGPNTTMKTAQKLVDATKRIINGI